MLRVRLIRHGESTGNAGAATDSPAGIPLSERGHEQARAIADALHKAPQLIICSPFLRTQQTATPTLARFPAARREVWDIHEFTYLSPPQFCNTTAVQRRPYVDAYWLACDPQFVHGEGAESFAALIGRVEQALERLAALPPQRVLVFSHGQFLQALRWRALHASTVCDTAAMRHFRAYDLASPILNAEGFTLRREQGAWRVIDGNAP